MPVGNMARLANDDWNLKRSSKHGIEIADTKASEGAADSRMIKHIREAYQVHPRLHYVIY
jgi:hypothetical protein